MNLLIDEWRGWRLINRVDNRSYYVHDTKGGTALLVTHSDGNRAIPVSRGDVWDASIGWDTCYPGFCPEPEIGRKRTKITLRRPLAAGARHDGTLSAVLRAAK